MTHTLHREGSEESLRDDFLLLVTPTSSCNNIGAAEKMKRIVDIIFDVGPINFRFFRFPESGHFNLPLSKEKVQLFRDRVKDNTKVRCVFNSREKFQEVIARIAEADLGISVVATGVRSVVEEILEEIHIHPHSINVAMGTYGATEKLPDKNPRIITTMCGHALVSPKLVEEMLMKIKRGRISIEEAGVELAKPCVCGTFNQERASRLLKEFLPLYNIPE